MFKLKFKFKNLVRIKNGPTNKLSNFKIKFKFIKAKVKLFKTNKIIMSPRSNNPPSASTKLDRGIR